MLKLVELRYHHKSKGGVFEIAFDRGGRLEILHWLGYLYILFIKRYNYVVLLDGTRKTNIYDLGLVVTPVVSSSSVSIPVGFLVTLSKIHHQ